jgi:hypothetical protein
MQPRSTRSDRTRPRKDSIYLNRNEIDGIVEHQDDLMATCYSHLRSALSVIEELLGQPDASPSDTYCYDQASGCVWVALVSLGQCGAGAPSQKWISGGPMSRGPVGAEG